MASRFFHFRKKRCFRATRCFFAKKFFGDKKARVSPPHGRKQKAEHIALPWRRVWDSEPCVCAKRTSCVRTADAQPLKIRLRRLFVGQNVIFSSIQQGHLTMPLLYWRRGWDSNPCGVTPKRFSRPPRYDRFDTSPNTIQLFSLRLFRPAVGRFSRPLCRLRRHGYDRFDTSPNTIQLFFLRLFRPSRGRFPSSPDYSITSRALCQAKSCLFPAFAHILLTKRHIAAGRYRMKIVVVRPPRVLAPFLKRIWKIN